MDLARGIASESIWSLMWKLDSCLDWIDVVFLGAAPVLDLLESSILWLKRNESVRFVSVHTRHAARFESMKDVNGQGLRQ